MPNWQEGNLGRSTINSAEDTFHVVVTLQNPACETPFNRQVNVSESLSGSAPVTERVTGVFGGNVHQFTELPELLEAVIVGAAFFRTLKTLLKLDDPFDAVTLRV
jgi:hypothetical protein